MQSQFGQAEWILDLMNSCGVEGGTVFEAGAQSPHEISNSKCFIEAGWNAVLVEAESHHCDEWSKIQNDRIEIYNELIPYTPNSMDTILSRTVRDRKLDVLFLDIDGSEYYQIKHMSQFRPSVICVEYDNSYPLSIDYIPKMLFHSVPSGQASSKATFKLMLQKDYVYIKSFFLDHIFVSQEFYDLNIEYFSTRETGIDLFIKKRTHLYNIFNVALYQQEGSGGSGVLFYKEKVMNLIKTDQLPEASSYYHILSNYFHTMIPHVLEKRGEIYLNEFKEALTGFDNTFSKILFFS